MCLMLDQFLWGHSSRVCDISCSKLAFSKILSGTLSECQRVWIKSSPDMGPYCLQRVSADNKLPLARKELEFTMVNSFNP